MGRRPPRPEPIDWEAGFRKLTERLGKGKPPLSWLGGSWYLIPLAIVVVIWLLTGIYSVGPGERGVIRQFGARLAGETGPGLHYHLPWPIQKASVVNVEQIRTAQIGWRTLRGGAVEEIPEEALMLTGDENIVHITLVVQYRVMDAGDYLFNMRDPDRALKAAAEVALRGMVGQNTIDYVMVQARAEVEASTREFLQRLMDSYRSGLRVTKVSLQAVDAPEEVRDAFNDVVRAREDRDRLVREAEGYAADIVPRARGEKEKAIKEAEAYKEQRIIRAHGDADRFLKVLEEYRKAPQVTRQRLYLETVESVLPGIEKIIIDPQGASNLLPLLPLREMAGLAPAAVEPVEEEGGER